MLVVTLIIGLLAFLLCSIAIGVCRPLMVRYHLLDVPNERSSHEIPVPRGGGWAIGLTLLAVGLLIALMTGMTHHYLWLAVGFCLLMAISALDDNSAVSAKMRIFVQLGAVLCGFQALGLNFHQSTILAPLLQIDVPGWLEGSLILVGWIWFINLFNFMDGLDGLAASGGISFCLGVILIAAIYMPAGGDKMLVAAAVTGALGGFLCWNWHPAKIFMGDTGSVPLGFTLGFLLLAIAQAGFPFAALILPLYFVTDTTVTLVRRLARGEKFWQAHREFFFHKAQSKLQRHDAVVGRVILCHMVLLGCALWSVPMGYWALFPAAFAVLVLCRHFMRLGRS